MNILIIDVIITQFFPNIFYNNNNVIFSSYTK